MTRLGYTEFVAQGTDWGAIITDVMATQTPEGLLAIHTNRPGVVPLDVWQAVAAGGPSPSGLSAEETHAYEKLTTLFAKGVAYAIEMGTRPQTLYGIADSPVGLAAWLFDHGDGAAPTAPWMAAIRKRTEEEPETELTRDDVRDNISLRATFPRNASRLGYVRYAERTFDVVLTPDLETEIERLVQLIRRGRFAVELHRSHSIPARCRACPMRTSCCDALS